MIEVLKKMVEALEWCHGGEPVGTAEAIEAGKQAIAELESLKPVAWLLTEKNINSLQVDSIELLINRLKHAHHTDLCVRINGQDEWFQADWLKHMVRVTAPQRTEPVALPCCGYTDASAVKWNPLNGVVQCHNCGQNYTTSQRTWVGLTDDEHCDIWYKESLDWMEYGKAIEAKLKEKNT
jgi:transcription elongation factor Elf1